MKTILSTCLIFFITLFYAQSYKNVGDFSKVTAFDKIKIVLILSDENKVIASGNDSESVQFVNNNGELKIRMPIDKILAGENISVKVYYKKISAVEANEGSRISAENIIESTAFEVITKEGSIINIDVESKKLISKVSSGAVVSIGGSTNYHDAIVNSGGVLNSKELTTAQTTITCNAGGEATVFATDYVNAKVRAGGNIVIFGKPKQIDQKTILGGTITQK